MTADTEPTPTDGAGRPGWRDVYRAVGESEERIKDAIRDAVAPLSQRQLDHEERLRKIEGGTLGWVNKLEADATISHAVMGGRIGALESTSKSQNDQITFFRDREQGVFATIGAGKTFILMIAAVLSPIIALFVALSH